MVEDKSIYDRIRRIMVKKDAQHLPLTDNERILLTSHWRDFPRSFIRRNVKEILWNIMYLCEFPHFTSQDISEMSDVIFYIDETSFQKEDWEYEEDTHPISEEEAMKRFEDYRIDIIYNAVKRIPDIPVYYIREMIIKYIKDPKYDKFTKAIQIYCKIPENLIEEFYLYMDKKIISCCQTLSPRFIKDHKEDLYWTGITARQYMSLSFIIENYIWIDKSILFQRYDLLSEESLEFLIKKLVPKKPSPCRDNPYKWISERRYMSIRFARKYQNELDWNRISRCICLTEPFVYEFYNYLDPHELERNVTYSERIKELYEKRMKKN